jgi:hypothetical protein
MAQLTLKVSAACSSIILITGAPWCSKAMKWTATTLTAGNLNSRQVSCIEQLLQVGSPNVCQLSPINSSNFSR